MPIYRLLREGAFEPEAVEVLADAYEQALLHLQLTDRNDPLTEVVAKEVIKAGRMGLRDAALIRQEVLRALEKP